MKKNYPNLANAMKELLLLLCRYPFEEKNRESLSNLIREVKDWHKTVELINAHGIIALAAYNIKEAGLEKEIPEDAMAILENGQRQSMVRNLWLTERWKEVNTILSNAGIKHILLKGMALEHTLYGSKGLRQMTDNDILVKREDAMKAWTLLYQNGFSPELIKSPLHRKIIFEIGNHLPALYKNGYAIEIHDKLSCNINEEIITYFDLFNKATGVFIGDTKAYMLPPEIQLMHLINHYESHALDGCCQLRLYSDIILLDKKNQISVPDHFISEPIQENKPKFRNKAFKRTLYSIDSKHRLQFLIGDIFPSLEWMKKRYGCSGLRAVFYYPQRIGKLFWLV